MSTRAVKSNAGFTMIEVLLVSVLLFFLAFATFQSVRSTIRTKEQVDASVAKIQEARAALSIVSRDLEMAYYQTPEDLTWKNPGPPQQQSGEVPAPPPPRPPVITIFQGKANEVFLSSNSHQRMAPNTPENQQHFVTYQLDGDKLKRGESARAVNLRDRESPDKFREFILLERVSKLTFSYWDSKGEKWTDSWDTEKADTKDQLPVAVKIELEYTPEEDAQLNATQKPQPILVGTAVRLTQPSFKK